MNWNKISVKQYQKIHHILIDNESNRLDKLTLIISILTGKSEAEIDSMPLNKIHKYNYIFEDKIPIGKPIKRIKVNGRHYRFEYNIQKLPAARYIESKHFVQKGYIENLHTIMASCVIPQKKILWFYFDKKYNAADHSKYADDMLDAPFPFVYNASVFFCKVFKAWIDYILFYLEKEMSHKMNKDKMIHLKDYFKTIMDGFIPPYL
jgi:hypothetical protein